MFLLYMALTGVVNQTTVDPLRLPLGPKGEWTVQVGQLFDLRRNREASLADVVRAADKQPFLFLGENHATSPHQQLQADLIVALIGAGREVVVGVEMFTRPKQSILDDWSRGVYEEPEFLEKGEWKTQWGFDYAFYRPVFEAVRRHRLPLVALNVPRDWVRAVGRQGYAALQPDWRRELPSDLFLGNQNHRSIFNALMGGHPPTGPGGENIYAAQVLWDEGMADTAIKWLASKPKNDKRIFVVIAGSGHLMYGEGINYRIRRRTGQTGPTVVMTQAGAPIQVSKGLGEFVFVTPEKPKSASGSGNLP